MSCEYCEDAKSKKAGGKRITTKVRTIALLGQPTMELLWTLIV